MRSNRCHQRQPSSNNCPALSARSQTQPDRSQRLKPVDVHIAAPPTPDDRETTDDLLEALRPNVELVDDREPVSAPESELRPVEPVAAHPQRSDAVRQAPPQPREVAGQQFCEIRLWRGWVKCQLYAEVEGSPGAFATSPHFRLRNPMVPDDRAHKILSDLLADLERTVGRSWTRDRPGTDAGSTDPRRRPDHDDQRRRSLRSPRGYV